MANFESTAKNNFNSQYDSVNFMMDKKLKKKKKNINDKLPVNLLAVS